MRELFKDEHEFLMVQRIVENELLVSGTRASRVRMAMNWVNGKVKIGDVEFHLQPLPSGGNRMKITDGDGSSTIEKFWSREEAETFIANYISKTKGSAAKQMAAQDDVTVEFYKDGKRDKAYGYTSIKAATEEADAWAVQGKKFHAVIVDHNNGNKRTRIG